MDKLPKLSSLTTEDTGWGYFLCTYKEVRAGRSGSEFLFLSLQDSSAQVVAKLLADVERNAVCLRQLADLGIRIALDDFGAGFCNFRYLKHLPLHSIKLDRSMIEGITDDERDHAVLRGILAMANALDLGVTAEGIETEGQRAIVVQEGCTTWQGFLGSQPVLAEAFAELATRSAAPG